MSSKSTEAQELIEHASQAMDQAYCPYSNFPVGAALLTDDGNIVTGCNVENASLPVGVCAERTAVAKAVSEGYKSFVSLAVITKMPEINYPCGMCRQTLNEFAPDITIYCANKSKEFTTTSLKNLLPRAFGPRRFRES